MGQTANGSGLRKVWLLASCALASALAACSSPGQASGRPPGAAELRGKQAYGLACKKCHEPFDLQTAKDGPSLYGLFGKATLPSGAPATDEQVRGVILRGRGKMRPVDPQLLPPEDVGPLIAYLHTR